MSTSSSQSNQNPASEQADSVSVGDILSNERVRQGLTEKDVADRLHITMHYVRSIEANSFEKLPGSVFAKGYIKSYAMLLGLDVDVVLKGYNEFVTEQQDAAREKTRIQVRRRKDKGRLWGVISVVTFAVLFLLLWFFSGSSTQVLEVAESKDARSNEAIEPALTDNPVQPELTNSAEVSESASTAEPIQQEAVSNDLTAEFEEDESGDGVILEDSSPILTTAELETNDATDEIDIATDDDTVIETSNDSLAAPLTNESELVTGISENEETSSASESGRIIVEAEGNDVLVITFSGESWVEVSDGFETLIYRDLQEAGNELEVRGTAPFNILLGDAPFASLTLNGADVDFANRIRIDNSARLEVGL
ncbi:MAG: helix-turn-helix domain-containing protein [Pseudohongiellaceae bacterium]